MQLNNQAEKYFFLLLIAVIVFLGFLVVSPIFSAIVFAFLTSLIFQPVYKSILGFTRNRLKLSVILTMITILVTFLIPLLFLIQLTISQLIQFHSDLRNMTENWDVTLDTTVTVINDNLEWLGLSDQQITVTDLQENIDQAIGTVVRGTLNFVVQISSRSLEIFAQFFVYIFLLYFLLPVQSKIPRAISKISPLDDEIDNMFITRTTEMAKSMIRGTFVIAIVQSVVGGILLAFFGAQYVVFWIVIMIFLGIIPIVGPSLVMIPAGIIYLLIGNYGAAITILVLNTLFISNIDNFLRPRLVSKLANLHPALVLIGVLGGLKAFGVLGVIYGPVIMILLTTLLQVYEITRGKG